MPASNSAISGPKVEILNAWVRGEASVRDRSPGLAAGWLGLLTLLIDEPPKR
jgi:hypothetical protein